MARYLVRAAVAAAAAAGVALLAPLAAPAPVSAQERCLPPGEAITPVPWPQQLLRPDRVWPLTIGEGQRVAIVGTGIGEHPQLAGAVVAATDLALAPEFGEPSGQPDCLGIGTGVAGVVAARQIDGVGFHGTAPGAELLAAKVVGDQYPTEQEPRESIPPGRLASGIDWAVDQGATVIVVSTVADRGSTSLADAVTRAHSADAVVVATVGALTQDADQPDGAVPYPAAYDEVIGVGALSQEVMGASPQLGYVDLVAPGVEILTSYPDSGLGPATGAEFAAGYVAGTAALVRSYHPELSAAQVAHRLFATAAPAPEAAVSPRYGYGIVHPYGAVVDRVVDGDQHPLDSYQPAEVSEAELARDRADRDSEWLAAVLAFAGLGLAVLFTAAVGFGRSGRRRRWRPGLATPPAEAAFDPHPVPPAGLFGSRPHS
ncbi:S8 family serine peptidase [Natronosporangium hydrolyticum]|uniref:S8 family serine peptidase n=1 Tax=Natronosporangium hydrolyticum TaxID=2811111 RepID=A0A895YN17_9ACTN|nr:S8 family serine peptidase [Natronosporangium hydrolyticum]QSB15318.1 S8 family serine peptidase [Natronosporangium hydrolyticum]